MAVSISWRRFVLLLPLLVTGCETAFQTDLVKKGAVVSQAGTSTVVDLAPPSVMQNGDTVDITGTVTRKSGFDGAIKNGYVLVQLIDPKGSEIDELWSTWTPADIPTDGSRSATYQIHYLWNPTPGTTVNVLYGPTAEGLAAGGSHGTGSVAHAVAGSSKAPPAAHHSSSSFNGSFTAGLGFHR
jgi:hypothetical protein